MSWTALSHHVDVPLVVLIVAFVSFGVLSSPCLDHAMSQTWKNQLPYAYFSHGCKSKKAAVI